MLFYNLGLIFITRLILGFLGVIDIWEEKNLITTYRPIVFIFVFNINAQRKQF